MTSKNREHSQSGPAVRAAACAVATPILAALLAGCSGSATPVGPASPSAGAPPAATGPAPSAAPPETLGRDDEEARGPAATVAGAAVTAAAFAKAWARPRLGAAAWWRGVAPLCETRFAQQLRTVEPANLPASRITSRPRATQPVRDGGGQFAVATDGGTLLVTVADMGGRWLVIGNDFQRTGQ